MPDVPFIIVITFANVSEKWKYIPTWSHTKTRPVSLNGLFSKPKNSFNQHEKFLDITLIVIYV